MKEFKRISFRVDVPEQLSKECPKAYDFFSNNRRNKAEAIMRTFEKIIKLHHLPTDDDDSAGFLISLLKRDYFEAPLKIAQPLAGVMVIHTGSENGSMIFNSSEKANEILQASSNNLESQQFEPFRRVEVDDNDLADLD